MFSIRFQLVEFPRPGYWAVGMVATTPKGEIADKLPGDEPKVAVFLGLTPMTSGILLFVPQSEVIALDMKTDEAVKLIVSAATAPEETTTTSWPSEASAWAVVTPTIPPPSTTVSSRS